MNLFSDQTNDVTLETGSQDEEEDEVDILEQIRKSHEEAARERQDRSGNEEAQSAAKRPRLEAQQRSSTPTPSQQVVTAAQEPQVLQPQPQQGSISITMDQLESLVTRAVAASSSQNSLHEAIHQQTSTLAQVVRGSGAVQEENLVREPKINDRSWWLTLESVDVEDNSQTKL